MMNVRLSVNFNLPYFASSMTEFCRRWHITLYQFFEDYVFQPFLIATRNQGRMMLYIGLLLVFALSGIWHGFKLTFLVWGIGHGIILSLEYIFKKQRKAISKKLLVMFTFAIWTLMLVWFRAANLDDAMIVYQQLFSFDHGWASSLVHVPLDKLATVEFKLILITLPLIIVIEFWRNSQLLMQWLNNNSKLRWLVYQVCIILFVLFGHFASTNSFIYFQF